MSTAPETATITQDAPRSGSNLYTFVAAQLRTRYLPGGNTEQIYQVTAIAATSGVYFFHNFRPNVYAEPAQVKTILDSLAGTINTWSTEPYVQGMTAVQVIDSQDQFVNMFDVEVASSSGASTTVIRVPYPSQDSSHPGTVAFRHAVNDARAQLDAVENA